MKFLPELEEAVKLKNESEYKIVPISTEILSDITTPIEVMKKLKSVSSHCYMLESIEDNRNWGRYTFLGYEPRMEISCTNSKLVIKGEKELEVLTSNPGEYIREILKEYKSKQYEYLPTFTGGLVGYFSYDYIKYAESSLNLDAKDEEHFKDVDLMLFDKVITFDHYKQKIILIQNVKLDDIETGYDKAVKELERMLDLIKNYQPKEIPKGRLTSDYRFLFEEEEYKKKVELTKNQSRFGNS